ncbi:Uncharacterised protein [Mycobacteroides abscessus subsp. abscessus]|nr:Uncharacterised protein [Mycobacteroides abscessus subsp. abscessus]
MVFDASDTAGVGHPDHHGHREHTAGAIAQFGHVGHDLFKRGIGEGVELHLDHRAKAPHRHTHREPDDSRFCQRSIETPVGAEGFGKTIGDPEDTPQRADVLAEHHHRIVVVQRIAQCSVESLRHSGHGHGRSSESWAVKSARACACCSRSWEVGCA